MARRIKHLSPKMSAAIVKGVLAGLLSLANWFPALSNADNFVNIMDLVR